MWKYHIVGNHISRLILKTLKKERKKRNSKIFLLLSSPYIAKIQIIIKPLLVGRSYRIHQTPTHNILAETIEYLYLYTRVYRRSIIYTGGHQLNYREIAFT